jgi:hypothetical protein
MRIPQLVTIKRVYRDNADRRRQNNKARYRCRPRGWVVFTSATVVVDPVEVTAVRLILDQRIMQTGFQEEVGDVAQG